MEISEHQIECLFEFCDTGSEADEEFKASSVKLSYSLNNVLLTNKGSPDVRSLKESDKNDSDESSMHLIKYSSLNFNSELFGVLFNTLLNNICKLQLTAGWTAQFQEEKAHSKILTLKLVLFSKKSRDLNQIELQSQKGSIEKC